MSRWVVHSLLISVLLIAGCTSARARQGERAVQHYFAGNTDRAVSTLRELAMEPDENFVLNNVRLGSIALAQYDLVEAEAAFLRAYEVLNATGVSAGGRTLGAILVDEKLKVWKGEPYERAMANFYLGLVYCMQHDYENARAAFENALFKLRDYADPKKPDKFEEFESDFVPAFIMLGRAYQRLGRDDLAHANFDHVTRMRPYLSSLANYDIHARSNVLLVIDFGHAPRKVTDFDGAIVGFSPTPREAGRIPPPQVLINGQRAEVSQHSYPPMDLVEMAEQRRWQSIDTIRATKSAVGTGLIAGGALYGAHSASRGRTKDLGVAAGLVGTGLLLKATSQADVRQWEMLPRSVFLIPLQLPPGEHEITVSFPHAWELRQTWRNLVVPEQGEATYYFRMRRWYSGPFDWPPAKLVEANSNP